MLAKPGDKVLIIEDCREGSPATGQVGVYEGEFPRGAIVFVPDGSKEFCYDEFVSGKTRAAGGAFDGHSLAKLIPFWSPGGDEPHPCGDDFPMKDGASLEPPYWFSSTNPRIKLPDGSTIWGDECWWGDAKNAPPTLEEAQADLEDHKTILRGMAQAMADE